MLKHLTRSPGPRHACQRNGSYKSPISGKRRCPFGGPSSRPRPPQWPSQTELKRYRMESETSTEVKYSWGMAWYVMVITSWWFARNRCQDFDDMEMVYFMSHWIIFLLVSNSGVNVSVCGVYHVTIDFNSEPRPIKIWKKGKPYFKLGALYCQINLY